jgi:L,D-transpeptidase YcbB
VTNNERMDVVRIVAIAVIAMLAQGMPSAAERLLWFDGTRPTRQAESALNLLADARSHGLEANDYDAERLAREFERARGERAESAAISALDHRLTAAVERYLADLHHGRIGADQLPRGHLAPQVRFDAAATLRSALAGNLEDAARAAAPRLAQYERLRDALAHYRTLAGHAAWSSPLPALPAGPGNTPPKLEPGQPYTGAGLLRERLIALGDLPPESRAAAHYDDTLADGIRAFQQRHGLAVDGIIGKATLAQLNVQPAARVRQIELMLERLRWTPLMLGPRMIVINIPEFVLRAYEVDGDRIAVRETMRVIVGKAMNTRTPLFVEPMRHIEFQPFWNVPPSIARNEVVPRLRRDPAYWEREGFEFVAAGGVDAQLSAARLDDVLAGRTRIRQRPGVRNALGDIKFVFPNHDNIYLHHTPSVRLFERDRRDFSHGCIRVEAPVALAAFALQDLPGWTEPRIRSAMQEGEPRTVRLPAPIPVVITYGTAIFKEGRIHFFDDIYGQDRRLDAALRERRPPNH